MTRTTRGRRTGRLVAAIATSGALLLSACGGSSLNEAPPAAEGSTAPCGEVNMAMNAWVGYTASASVVSYVAENELGCTPTSERFTTRWLRLPPTTG